MAASVICSRVSAVLRGSGFRAALGTATAKVAAVRQRGGAGPGLRLGFGLELGLELELGLGLGLGPGLGPLPGSCAGRAARPCPAVGPQQTRANKGSSGPGASQRCATFFSFPTRRKVARVPLSRYTESPSAKGRGSCQQHLVLGAVPARGPLYAGDPSEVKPLP